MNLRLKICFSLIASMGLCQFAQADCTYPQPPSTVPDGKSASKDEMISAMTAFKDYNTSATEYMACLEKEMDEKKKSGVATSMLMDLKALHARKHNAALAELETKAKQFNEQVRIFKARG